MKQLHHAELDRLGDRPLGSLRLRPMTADHSMRCELKAHSEDPVPLLICGGLEPEGAEGFSERQGREGWLGRLKGRDLVPKPVSLSESRR